MAVIVQSFVLIGLHRWYDVGRLSEWDFWLTLPGMCLDMAWLGVFWMITRSERVSLLWRCFFLLLALQKAFGLVVLFLLFATDVSRSIDTLVSVQTWISETAQWLLIASILAALVQDWMQRRECRWTHWLGAALYVGQILFIEAFDVGLRWFL